ncbi:pyrroline-5-carboxylate reductase ProG [Bacillus vallismortis]|uniref:pyrroline-5-carboxylate reductase ProG n=1 Tax=Bacillus vallismortis TaxID=72361 RepID=UPI000288F90B|nr:pyrroline-5-carboxylate reductase ProG [Bacillus vallismortis]MBG9770096.1 pyrroline-5-carboxylate reductase [Bacillus vallismortis]MCY8424546.1 pyrroline-5-carboxylate reductase ProG [Bacillus vallismortis]MCY8533707.1 pyrroline-5-carboxylate reductase ProG [Bacillus vallismortis]MEC1269550.1 pyrroline-5-carboxylate reductase ProG [Bacillus vallismortis]QAV09200.1 pyrroline-5-carboxylate reductase [Bacillus vallismortis]
MEQIGLIGYGSMADMIARQLLKHGQIKENELFIETRTKGERLKALISDYPHVSVDSLENWADACRLILICVPPLNIIETMRRLHPYVNRSTHIVSIAAGVPLRLLEAETEAGISRVIPAITSEAEAGISLVVHSETLTADQKERLNERLSVFSRVREINESNIDAASNLTSSAPGFIAAIFEELALSAVRNSTLSKEEAFDFLIHSLYGTGKLLIEKKVSFEETLERVATKGGITGEGAEVIRASVPDVFDEMFERTLKKYELLTEQAEKQT